MNAIPYNWRAPQFFIGDRVSVTVNNSPASGSIRSLQTTYDGKNNAVHVYQFVPDGTTMKIAVVENHESSSQIVLISRGN